MSLNILTHEGEGERMIGFHCTTLKKLARYQATGGILPPVRFWAFETSARSWGRRTQRYIILKLEAEPAYPLPDHKPEGHAYWTPSIVTKWEEQQAVKEPK